MRFLNHSINLGYATHQIAATQSNKRGETCSGISLLYITQMLNGFLEQGAALRHAAPVKTVAVFSLVVALVVSNCM